MLQRIVKEGLLRAEGIVGIYQAQTTGDDIQVLDDDRSVLATLFGLRQQVQCVCVCVSLSLSLSLSFYLSLSLSLSLSLFISIYLSIYLCACLVLFHPMLHCVFFNH